MPLLHNSSKHVHHVPVLLSEFLVYSQTLPQTESILWDGTLGLGGHLKAWLRHNPNGFAYGSDVDQEMLGFAQENLDNSTLFDRVKVLYGNYADRPIPINQQFDVILLDLGLSSMHLDYFERGMSYKFDHLLDMRFDQTRGIKLCDWLSQAREEEIQNILWKYGEPRFSKSIARNIIRYREKEKIQYMSQLIHICQKSYFRHRSRSRYRSRHSTAQHPYVRALQAFRIFVNQELSNLQKTLTFIPFLLKPMGKLMIISFHSLEDRMVKHAFYLMANTPPAESQFCFKLVCKKPIIPSEEEINSNFRSRSAKMRILQRIL